VGEGTDDLKEGVGIGDNYEKGKRSGKLKAKTGPKMVPLERKEGNTKL